jgi:hypothetical protein
MAIQKKSLIGSKDKKKTADDGSGQSAANPAPPAKGKKLAIAKLATAKLSTAKLALMRKLK